MMRIVTLLVGLLVGLLFPTESNAISVRFDTSTMEPSETLEIEGVTVTSSVCLFALDCRPATVAGIGLGAAAGPAHSVDRTIDFTGGTDWGLPAKGTDIREGLRLSVDGVFNSITLLPWFSILEGTLSSASDMPDIEIYMNSGYYHVEPSTGSPITLDVYPRLSPSLEISLQSDFGPEYNFWSFLAEHEYPEVTIQYGFTVVSVDYTLWSVPESSSLFLLATGLAGLAAWRSRKSAS